MIQNIQFSLFIILFLIVLISGCNAESKQTILLALENNTENKQLSRSHSEDSLSIDGTDVSISFVHEGFKPNHVRGARIYDDFTVELDQIPTVANDLLAIATPIDPSLPTPSIADGWRCSHCHGFNYTGGIYTFGNGGNTNLVESNEIRKIDEDFVFNVLMRGFNVFNGTTHVNTHNYSLLLSVPAMVDVADFIVNEIFDPTVYIRDATNESIVNHMPSLFIYRGARDPILNPDPLAVRINGLNFTCTECHGPTGRQVPGIDLYALAWTQPFKWMHRASFGTPRSLTTYPNITTEDATIHPGLYEVILREGLHFGSSRQTAELLEFVQTHFQPQ